MERSDTKRLQEILEAESAMLPALEEFERFTDVIAHRAYQRFEGRGGNDGRDFDGRLQAERQVLGTPASEAVEKEDLLVLYLLLAGFTPEETAVMAGPNGVLLRAGPTPDEGVSRDGLDQPNVMRRFAFATTVDVDFEGGLDHQRSKDESRLTVHGEALRR